MPNTDGTSGAEKTAPETAQPTKSATPEPGADGNKGYDARIAALTAERDRKDEKIAKLEKQMQELVSQNKSEEEKRIEAIASERFKPKEERLAAVEGFLAKQRDELLAKIPAEHRGAVLVGENIPLEQQIMQATHVIGLLNKSLPNFSSGASPGTTEKRVYELADYNKWVGAIYSDPKFYESNRDEMQAAIKEGRIKGLR